MGTCIEAYRQRWQLYHSFQHISKKDIAQKTVTSHSIIMKQAPLHIVVPVAYCNLHGKPTLLPDLGALLHHTGCQVTEDRCNHTLWLRDHLRQTTIPSSRELERQDRGGGERRAYKWRVTALISTIRRRGQVFALDNEGKMLIGTGVVPRVGWASQTGWGYQTASPPARQSHGQRGSSACHPRHQSNTCSRPPQHRGPAEAGRLLVTKTFGAMKQETSLCLAASLVRQQQQQQEHQSQSMVCPHLELGEHADTLSHVNECQLLRCGDNDCRSEWHNLPQSTSR